MNADPEWTGPLAKGGTFAGRIAGAAARLMAALLAEAALGMASGPLLLVTLLTLAFSPVAGLGLPFAAIVIWVVRPVAGLQRRRARRVTGTPVTEAYRPVRGSLLARVRAVLTDPATWRDLAWLGVQFLAGLLAVTCLLLLAASVFAIAAPLARALLPARSGRTAGTGAAAGPQHLLRRVPGHEYGPGIRHHAAGGGAADSGLVGGPGRRGRVSPAFCLAAGTRRPRPAARPGGAPGRYPGGGRRCPRRRSAPH